MFTEQLEACRQAGTGAPVQHALAANLVAALQTSLREAQTRLSLARNHPKRAGLELNGVKLARRT